MKLASILFNSSKRNLENETKCDSKGFRLTFDMIQQKLEN